MTRHHRLTVFVFLGLLAVLGASQFTVDHAASAQDSGLSAPRFEVDPMWPRPLPNHWLLGNVIGVWVDQRALKSISHTKARRDANEAGARIATMPGISEEMFIRTLSGDYNEIKERSLKLAQKLKNVKDIRVTTALGTDITMNFEQRIFEPDSGIIEGNDFGNLPGGEVMTGPLEGTSNGVVIVDGVMSGIGMLNESIKITVENGYAVKIEGGEEAEKLRNLLEPFGKEAYNIAELGIGTNHMARLSGNVLEDEKVFGTVHVALGNNASYGGKVTVGIHLDGIIKSPTLVADGEVLIENGVWKF